MSGVAVRVPRRAGARALRRGSSSVPVPAGRLAFPCPYPRCATSVCPGGLPRRCFGGRACLDPRAGVVAGERPSACGAVPVPTARRARRPVSAGARRCGAVEPDAGAGRQRWTRAAVPVPADGCVSVPARAGRTRHRRRLTRRAVRARGAACSRPGREMRTPFAGRGRSCRTAGRAAHPYRYPPGAGRPVTPGRRSPGTACTACAGRAGCSGREERRHRRAGKDRRAGACAGARPTVCAGRRPVRARGGCAG